MRYYKYEILNMKILERFVWWIVLDMFGIGLDRFG